MRTRTHPLSPLHPLRRYRALLLVLFMALVVRAGVFAVHHPFPPLAKDDAVYDKLAWNLISGNGFSASPDPPYEPMSVRTPGYPAFLGGVYLVAGRSADAVRAVQIVLSVLTCLMIFVLTRRLLDESHAIGAAGLYALLPAAAHYPSLLLTEANQALLLVALVYCAYRAAEHPRLWRWFAACAVLLAVATIVRPESLLLMVLLFAALAAIARDRSAAAVRGAAAVACVVLLLTPWVIRNYRVFGHFIGLSSGSGHMLVLAQLESDGKTPADVNAEMQRRYGAAFEQKYGRPMTFIDGALPDQDNMRRKDAIAFMTENPWRYARHSIDRAIRLWLPSSWSGAVGMKQDFSEYYAGRHFGALAVKFAMLLFDGCVLALAAIGVFLAAKQWRRFAIVLVPVVYLSLVYSLVYSGGRYRVPLLPLVAILTVYGASRLGAAVLNRLATRRAPVMRRDRQAIAVRPRKTEASLCVDS